MRQFLTGHVTIGGSICTQLLTKSGWISTASLENIIVQIRAEIVADPNAQYAILVVFIDPLLHVHRTGWTSLPPSTSHTTRWKRDVHSIACVRGTAGRRSRFCRLAECEGSDKKGAQEVRWSHWNG